jgi:hypothetical protein
MRKLPLLFVAVLYPILLNAATFGPEVPVAPPDYSSAYGYQTASSVARRDDGSVAAPRQTFAAVWTESFQSTTTIQFQRFAEDSGLLAVCH